MKLVYRKLKDGETDYETIFGVLALTGIVVAFFMEPGRAFLPKCPFQSVLGVPCPTCGMTRSVMAAVRLHFRSALSFNPLGFFLTLVAVLTAAYWLGFCLWRKERFRLEPPPRASAVIWCFVTALLLNWVLVIWLHGVGTTA